MAEPATSGLGRNGPWLQNAWLRVETRQDDGSISPVALTGAFRPLERAVASAKPADGRPPITFARCDYDVRAFSDELGAGRMLTLVSRRAREGATLRREVALYDARPFLVTRVGVTNDGGAPLPLRALHAFASPEGGRGRLQLASKPADARVYRNGWQSWSPTMSLGGAEGDTGVAPPVNASEPQAGAPGRFASDDVGVLYDPASGHSLLVGAVTARALLTQVRIDVPGRGIDARCLCDGVPLAPGETRWSERIAVDLTGRPNDQLERYGDALGRLMGARVPARTPSGWCSWYYFFTGVTEDDIVRNLRFLEQHRRELPVETVQIDDGYQADIGDWLTVNEKFPRGMAWLAREIRRAGYTPGIWLAPFLLAESSKTFAEHPEWVVRDAEGAPAVAQHNWERRNHAIDGSHPGARAWLTELFREVCDGWGYDYVKIDFLFAAAIAGLRHDPGFTRIEAYRAALEAVRAGTGPERFILGCGALMAPSVGVFDGNRIGPDVAPFWRFLTREERRERRPRARRPDDGLSAETSIRNALTRSWMHGRLWANDPDCLLVREDRTKLTLDEVRTLTAAIGLSAGMMLSSDDLERLSPERLGLISLLLPPLPHAAEPIDLIARDMPERCELRFERPDGELRLAGLFNFDDDARDVALPLPGGRWDAVSLWDERYLGAFEGELRFRGTPPHASHVVAMRPAGDGPRLLATTAHIGMGALDAPGSTWDPASGALRVRIEPVGRRTRRVLVAGGGRRARSASLGGAAASLREADGAWVVDLEVEEASELIVTFES